MEAPFKAVIYEGYVRLHIYTTPHNVVGFMYKVLDAPPGHYYVEIPLGGGTSLLSPVKYYRYGRQDRRKGGGSGVFQLPLDTLRTLVTLGFHEPGSDFIYAYVRIWSTKPQVF